MARLARPVTLANSTVAKRPLSAGIPKPGIVESGSSREASRRGRQPGKTRSGRAPPETAQAGGQGRFRPVCQTVALNAGTTNAAAARTVSGPVVRRTVNTGVYRGQAQIVPGGVEPVPAYQSDRPDHERGLCRVGHLPGPPPSRARGAAVSMKLAKVTLSLATIGISVPAKKSWWWGRCGQRPKANAHTD